MKKYDFYKLKKKLLNTMTFNQKIVVINDRLLILGILPLIDT